jgi:hypothetical protein
MELPGFRVQFSQSRFFVRGCAVVRLIKVLIIGVVVAQLASCLPFLGLWSPQSSNDEDEESEETVETGFVVGVVTEPSLVDNDVTWTGAEGVFVGLFDADFSTYTLSDGSYMLADVPVGNYEIFAVGPHGHGSDVGTVIVLPDVVSIVPDLHAATDDTVIIYGSITESDKTTPLPFSEIKAYSGTDTLRSDYFGSATTNASGEFIIEVHTYQRIYLLHNGTHIKFYSTYYGYDTDFFTYNSDDTVEDGCAIFNRQGYLVE